MTSDGPEIDDAHTARNASALAGGGEMGALMRTLDWSRTPVGPVDRWPQSLRTALSILLETGFPMYIAWGREFIQFYNDGYRPILGSTKHPDAMGRSTRETFAEIWNIIGPMFEGVMQGQATTLVDFMLPLDRHGFVEECYFIFSYSPIRQEDGTVGGVLVTVTETTQRVIGHRRLQTTQALAARTKGARSVEAACETAATVLAENPLDLPFTLIYLIDGDENTATLAGTAGLEFDGSNDFTRIRLDGSTSLLPLKEATDAERHVLVEGLPPGLAFTADGPPPSRAVIAPIVEQGTGTRLGVLVAGISARLALDDDYERFHSLLVSQVAQAITSARSFAEAEARAQALLELDQAKTAFFSNISHEFRTPLTLILGPLEDAVMSPDQMLRNVDLVTVYRNSLRLLKLVNALLDFSASEAGRTKVAFRPTDLSSLTTDLASSFRSAVVRAGLSLDVQCEPLPTLIYVDQGMWEKIVLNLLSNALKFTFQGGISVSLSGRDTHVELTVQDTGVGIPEDQVPHIFERFHRVTHSHARTHEGTGIGLALVKDLVDLHGGNITVSTDLNVGTTFTVTIPTGRAHLPYDAIASTDGEPDERHRNAFVEEALRWLPATDTSERGYLDSDVRILVADDNADMREYLERLLGERWNVTTVGDGAAALEYIRREPLDLLLTDVMMPELDGFDLLRRIRENESTRALPVIMLSARAGQEARLDGLDAGADDYLVKPFSAREIIARVQAQIVRVKVRKAEAEQTARIERVFEQAPIGVAMLRGPEHVFDLANPRYLELIDNRPVLGLPIREALPELEGQEIYDLLDAVYSTGEPYEGKSRRVVLARGDERVTRYFNFIYQPLFDARQLVTGIAVAAVDVTELSDARREAESASRAKDEFLAMLSHELRNPLSPILTALEMMRLTGSKESERERAVIERQVNHLVELVSDLMDVARLARGAMELHRETLNLSDVVTRGIEMFVQERQSIDRSQGGLGLGLSIVKSLVTAHGGSVAAHSEGLGQGSEFSVRLPLASPASSEPSSCPVEDAGATRRRSILVVDDNEEAADMLATALRMVGHHVRVAHDGPSALELIDSFPADAVLLDIGLPVMNGIEVARRLRKDPRFAGLTLIAVTGYGMQSDEAQSRMAGFDAHLVKPVPLNEITRLLDSIESHQAG